MRAIRARYNPFLQTRHRVEQLRKLGHSVDKVEFIVMGGTFLSMDPEYRDYFIRNLHDALSGHTSNSVKEAIQFSEQSKTKCIGYAQRSHTYPALQMVHNSPACTHAYIDAVW